MKRYEKESLFKNFLVFFSLLEALLLLLFLELYHTQKREYKQNLFKTMHICNYTMKCTQFTYDFAPKDKTKLNELFDNDGLHGYFPIPKSEKFYMELTYSEALYKKDLRDIKKILVIKFIFATILLFGIALFFTFYSLNPIRKALQVNEEFIKDILHDFNTPITSMVLNMKMFQEEKGKDPYIERVSHSIDTILLLQNNLKSFLYHSPSQSVKVNIAALAEKRLDMMQNIYPKLTFTLSKYSDLVKITNEDLLTRILDNILSNAAKYNKQNGSIKLTINHDTLSIQDTGKGIQDIDNVMQRYHKEQERGLGLGLHIVQKLTNELNIGMKINSVVDEGTEIILDFSFLKREEK